MRLRFEGKKRYCRTHDQSNARIFGSSSNLFGMKVAGPRGPSAALRSAHLCLRHWRRKDKWGAGLIPLYGTFPDLFATSSPEGHLPGENACFYDGKSVLYAGQIPYKIRKIGVTKYLPHGLNLTNMIPIMENVVHQQAACTLIPLRVFPGIMLV